jgi:hypothetical protein
MTNGSMQDYVQDETPKRPVKDRLGTRRSKCQTPQTFRPIETGMCPPQEAPNSIEKPGTGIKLDTGTQSKTKTVMMMNWEMLNPQMRRENKNKKSNIKIMSNSALCRMGQEPSQVNST